MEIKAQHRNARMSARKLRLMRSIVRGLSASEAEAQLQFMPGHAAEIVQEVLKSAIANASHNYDVAVDKLKVADLVVDESFKIKRFRAGSRGTAKPIHKYTSHVTVILEEVGAVKEKKRKAKKTEIETITTEDFAKQAAEIIEKPTEEKGEVSSETAVPAAHPSKANAAFQKVKMMQQGGDAKKAHRRKSISGD